MKKVLSLLLLAFVMCQCNLQTTQNKTEKKSPRDQYPEKFTENYICDRAKTLIDFVPDHAFDPSIKPAFTESYYNLLEEAWAVPVDNEYIGDEEFLYYFMTGNGDCNCDSHPKTILDFKLLEDDSAWVKMNYIHQDHEMLLHFENGEWVIADFDGTKEQMEDYIRNQRDYLKNLDLDSILNEEYKTSIETYFNKYPN